MIRGKTTLGALNALLWAVAAFLASPAQAQELVTKTFSWADPNFVPCEGMGINASGRIDLTIKYSSTADPRHLRIDSARVTTSYNFRHQASGNLWSVFPHSRWPQSPHQKWQRKFFADNGPQLQPKDSLSRYQLLTGSNASSLHVRGEPLRLEISVIFPQDGGNCTASFEQEFELP